MSLHHVVPISFLAITDRRRVEVEGDVSDPSISESDKVFHCQVPPSVLVDRHPIRDDHRVSRYNLDRGDLACDLSAERQVLSVIGTNQEDAGNISSEDSLKTLLLQFGRVVTVKTEKTVTQISGCQIGPTGDFRPRPVHQV